MAVVTISMPDDLHAHYASFSPKGNVAQEVVKQLIKFKEFNPNNDRVLVLPTDVRRKLEALHGRPFDTAEDLQAWVEKLTTIAVVDGPPIVLTPRIRTSLAVRAKAFKKPFNEYAKVAIERVLGQSF